MIIFKCKMCGGDLEIAEDVTIAECEYCGAKQTVPKVMDENLQNLFNRANTLRIKSEFDKAEKLYEKIIQADPTQAEAYWGLILCKYGIEYVDDPVTFKKVPTCHRTSFDPIVADEDYKSALEYADFSQRAIYEEQAREIDRIQKDILALAQNEESYDVFICYKETDSDGQRTQDSVIANDIYHQLTQEGFKVFYAAITLEGKLGSAYEPIIFAALNSAKVMLAIGTKPEYFNAVWVKNEWSRYLKIIKADRSKLLIPCYRDMDAYELPEEFAHLQAQDMSKIGFINDVVRGIQKVIKKDEIKEHESVQKNVTSSNGINIGTLLKRAFMFLEDEDWKSADEYCEKVLDVDPECAEAYLGKLLAELKINTLEKLPECAKSFENSNNYQKAVRFGDERLKSVLTECVEICKKNAKAKDEAERIEKARKDEAIRKIRAKKIQIATVCSLFIVALVAFVCFVFVIPHVKYKKAISLISAGKYDAAMAVLDELGDNYGKDKLYETAISLMNFGKYPEALRLFNNLGDYEDSVQKKELCVIVLKGEYKSAVEAGLVDFVFPEGVKTIPWNAFKDCSMLKSITIPEGVTSIGNSAFSGCSRLTNVILPDSVTHIEMSAFENCSYLASFTVGSGIKHIEKSVFDNCARLKNLYVSDLKTWLNVQLDGSNAHPLRYGKGDLYIDGKLVGGIVIPEGVKKIGDWTLAFCSNIKNVTIPDSVEIIGESAFNDNSGLTSVTIGNGVTDIGNWAFCCCENLKSIKISDSVTSIGSSAFMDCKSLKDITISPKVTAIKEYAFIRCSSLESVTIPQKVTSIGSGAFSGCDKLKTVNYGGSKGDWEKIEIYTGNDLLTSATKYYS